MLDTLNGNFMYKMKLIDNHHESTIDEIEPIEIINEDVSYFDEYDGSASIMINEVLLTYGDVIYYSFSILDEDNNIIDEINNFDELTDIVNVRLEFDDEIIEQMMEFFKDEIENYEIMTNKDLIDTTISIITDFVNNVEIINEFIQEG